ncbi:hypothetical protein Pelo_806 [Pelomyxa schiedti]|nr:hypothetical protein Pelo_806 [Pelomyxa schiedti]
MTAAATPSSSAGGGGGGCGGAAAESFTSNLVARRSPASSSASFSSSSPQQGLVGRQNTAASPSQFTTTTTTTTTTSTGTESGNWQPFGQNPQVHSKPVPPSDMEEVGRDPAGLNTGVSTQQSGIFATEVGSNSESVLESNPTDLGHLDLGRGPNNGLIGISEALRCTGETPDTHFALSEPNQASADTAQDANNSDLLASRHVTFAPTGVEAALQQILQELAEIKEMLFSERKFMQTADFGQYTSVIDDTNTHTETAENDGTTVTSPFIPLSSITTATSNPSCPDPNVNNQAPSGFTPLTFTSPASDSTTQATTNTERTPLTTGEQPQPSLPAFTPPSLVFNTGFIPLPATSTSQPSGFTPPSSISFTQSATGFSVPSGSGFTPPATSFNSSTAGFTLPSTSGFTPSTSGFIPPASGFSLLTPGNLSATGSQSIFPDPNVSQRENDMMTDTSQVTESNSQESTWKCACCEEKNDDSLQACAVCWVPRPNTKKV